MSTATVPEQRETPTGHGAPFVGDIPVSLDMMSELFSVDDNTPYTWGHRKVLPPHDGVCGRSRWWWKSKIVAWHEHRQATGRNLGGRPRTNNGTTA